MQRSFPLFLIIMLLSFWLVGLETDRASVITKESFCLCGVPGFLPTIIAYQVATFIKPGRRKEKLNKEEENAAL